jgi:hypothetical protein
VIVEPTSFHAEVAGVVLSSNETLNVSRPAWYITFPVLGL